MTQVAAPSDQDILVTNSLAGLFIARPDIKAIQRSGGEYNPVESPFTRADLLAHVSGEYTYGHYLLNRDNETKLMVFDIDLNKSTPEKNIFWNIPTSSTDGVWGDFVPGDPREIWRDRSATVARSYFKYQLRLLAETLAGAVSKELGVKVAATYTGCKGVHVYGFTGKMQAADVRDGAQIVLDSLGCFEAARGNAFYKHVSVNEQDGTFSPEMSFDGITVEVFPKQTTLDGKTHGNLVRLPLGRNLKNPNDPTFFLDFRTAMADGLVPRNPVEALTAADYWA